MFDEYGLRLNYTGEGYFDINGAAGDKATLSFDAPAGSYTVTLRLANGSTSTVADNFNRPIALTVDGGAPTAPTEHQHGRLGHMAARSRSRSTLQPAARTPSRSVQATARVRPTSTPSRFPNPAQRSISLIRRSPATASSASSKTPRSSARSPPATSTATRSPMTSPVTTLTRSPSTRTASCPSRRRPISRPIRTPTRSTSPSPTARAAAPCNRSP